LLGIDFEDNDTPMVDVSFLQQNQMDCVEKLWNRYKGLTQSGFSANFHLNKRSL
jgi:hypothetical protein